MFKMKKIILLFLIFFIKINADSFDKEFLDSFVRHYEFNAEGRYAHEYHPALLDKTAYSLDELEGKLKNNNFNLVGRVIICGYEEEAVPSYYPDFKREKINDEASKKSKRGWSQKLHNRFGFMTGFLFKDFNYFSQYWYPGDSCVFEHIDNDEIEIFDDRAEIFQKHAFGKALDLMLPVQFELLNKFKDKDFKGIFQDLIRFWSCLYNGEITVESKQVAGTQDILFSIEYAKHLLRSPLPLFKFFVGPDITYPVEVSCSQPKGATLHAQAFVKNILPKLVPKEDKSTVYVFCSFVDGVGKSTMLGNIKNYMKYGEDVGSFDRVDNSSSQLAEIFELKENVFIADLPAQVSHFTYKPDGLVYVSVQRELQQKEIKELQDFARLNQDKFQKEYETLYGQVKNIIDTKGYLAPDLNNIKMPDKTFLKNLVLLKKDQLNRWIPFKYKDKYYLFDYTDVSQVRVLMSLGFVQSEGLKNIESEQMLFFDGIRLPFVYDYFTSDLVEKLKINNIENVVFVDFVSMYPRSSRENIRVNYLLQQMAILDSSFDVKYSLYRDFVNSSELLYLLKEREPFLSVLNSFELEALSRFALYKIILGRKSGDLEGYSLEGLTNLIKEEWSKITTQDMEYLKLLSVEKLKRETVNLEEIYGFTKNFVNIQQLSLERVLQFSKFLSDFFVDNIENERINSLWEGAGKVVSLDTDFYSSQLNKVMPTISGESVYTYYSLDKNCKDEHLLGPCIRMIRANWYAAILNLLDSQQISEERFFIEKEKYFVAPLKLAWGVDNNLYLTQNIFNEWEDKVDTKDKEIEEFFNLCKSGKIRWGEFSDKPYRLDYKTLGTNSGLFGFDCDMTSCKKLYQPKSTITFLVQKYQKECGQNLVMSTEKLYERLKESELWKKEREALVKQAEKNGEYGKEDKKKEKEGSDKDNKKKKEQDYDEDMGMLSGFISKPKAKVYLGREDQMSVLRQVVRMLVTLEMVIKDPDADVIVRFDNKEDFKAALKLFEKVILPKYFGILFKQDLFDNYEYIEPCI